MVGGTVRNTDPTPLQIVIGRWLVSDMTFMRQQLSNKKRHCSRSGVHRAPT